MNQEALIEELENISNLLGGILQELKSGKRSVKKNTKEVMPTSDQGSLPDKILALRETGFFHTPQSAKDVHTKIQESYFCEFNRIQVALNRLAGKRSLRIVSLTVDDKKQKAYVF